MLPRRVFGLKNSEEKLPMADGVLLDTSFLIALANPKELCHSAAQQFYAYFVEEGIPMFFSTIVAAEFYQRQAIPAAILDNMLILPFNHDDAKRAAELDFKRFQGSSTISRVGLKDDFKLLGQAKANGIRFILTADEQTLHRYCVDLRSRGELQTDPINLAQGFDKSYWDPAKQRDFDGKLSKPDVS
jgi:predicted nucleic acid-binding protein